MPKKKMKRWLIEETIECVEAGTPEEDGYTYEYLTKPLDVFQISAPQKLDTEEENGKKKIALSKKLSLETTKLNPNQIPEVQNIKLLTTQKLDASGMVIDEDISKLEKELEAVIDDIADESIRKKSKKLSSAEEISKIQQLEEKLASNTFENKFADEDEKAHKQILEENKFKKKNIRGMKDTMQIQILGEIGNPDEFDRELEEAHHYCKGKEKIEEFEEEISFVDDSNNNFTEIEDIVIDIQENFQHNNQIENSAPLKSTYKQKIQKEKTMIEENDGINENQNDEVLEPNEDEMPESVEPDAELKPKRTKMPAGKKLQRKPATRGLARKTNKHAIADKTKKTDEDDSADGDDAEPTEIKKKKGITKARYNLIVYSCIIFTLLVAVLIVPDLVTGKRWWLFKTVGLMEFQDVKTAKSLLERYDKDLDRKINKKEATSTLLDVWEKVDLNNDGFVDLNELADGISVIKEPKPINISPAQVKAKQANAIRGQIILQANDAINLFKKVLSGLDRIDEATGKPYWEDPKMREKMIDDARNVLIAIYIVQTNWYDFLYRNIELYGLKKGDFSQSKYHPRNTYLEKMTEISGLIYKISKTPKLAPIMNDKKIVKYLNKKIEMQNKYKGIVIKKAKTEDPEAFIDKLYDEFEEKESERQSATLAIDKYFRKFNELPEEEKNNKYNDIRKELIVAAKVLYAEYWDTMTAYWTYLIFAIKSDVKPDANILKYESRIANNMEKYDNLMKENKIKVHRNLKKTESIKNAREISEKTREEYEKLAESAPKKEK